SRSESAGTRRSSVARTSWRAAIAVTARGWVRQPSIPTSCGRSSLRWPRARGSRPGISSSNDGPALMDYRHLGNSGLQVSVLCLGTMMFGDRTDARESNEIVAHAHDHGVNFVDTADVYAGGASETITGAAIRERRSRWIVATKVGNPMPGAGNERPHTGGLSRRWIMQACDASLARLRTDWIDIYYLHIDDARTPLAETVAAMGALIDAGKIRYFGISNFCGWRIAELMHWCDRLRVNRPVVCQ